MKTGADCVIEGLINAGVKTVFGLPGGTVLDIFSKLYHAPIEFILVRHEQGATHMADAYARASGEVGVCLVTSGPGVTNAITGLATANMDGIPMVCITGQVISSMIGNDAFQEVDTIGITRPVTKHNYLVKNVDDLPRILAEAFYIAKSGKPGPVVVDIPKDIQRATTTAVAPAEITLRGYRPVLQADSKQIDKLADAIKQARRPLLYVGAGVISSNASEELAALAHRAHIPVTTTLLGLGAFPETDPLALRMLGMHGSVAANTAVSRCDLLIAVGARFDDRVTGKVSEFAPHAVKAHIDIDPSAIDKCVRVDIPVLGDVKQVLRELLGKVAPMECSEWLESTARWSAENPFTYDRNTKELLPQYVIEQIYELTRGDAIITTEVGQHQMWTAQYYKHCRPRSFLSSGGLGTMGFGLPAAIGAQAAFRDRLVIDIGGDGSTQMNIQELVVAVEHRLPIKVVVLNNSHLGMVRQWQEMFYNREYSATVLKQSGRPANERITPGAGAQEKYLPDFVKIAEAHGALGLRVRTREELIPALKKAFAAPGPVLVECIVRSEENVYPMVPPGASLMEMIHSMA